MKTTSRKFTAALLVAAMAVAPMGCSSGSSHDTPQAAFDAAKAAIKKDDYETFCATLTPQSQDQLAAAMVMAGSMMKMFAGMAQGFGGLGGEQNEEQKAQMAKMEASLAKIDKVLKDHGVDEKSLEAMKPTGPDADPQAAMAELGGKIKDKPAFIGAMMKAMTEMSDDPSKTPGAQFNGTLADVEVDGDSAKGVIVQTKDGKEQREPIEFKKIDGSWLLSLPMNMGGPKGPPAGAPPSLGPSDEDADE